MKKKLIVLLLALAMSVTSIVGCGKQPGTPSTPDKPSSVSVDTTGMSLEARIQAIGESYDGIYIPDYDEEDMAMNLDSLTAEAVCEPGAYSEEVYLYEDVDVDWNTENYKDIAESGFVSVATAPFSTFGADVDTATYSNLRNKLYENSEYGIDSNAIRTEELINYFSYDYPECNEGDICSVSTALVQCPWNEDTLLLRVGVRTEDLVPQNGTNIVFLIDTSGSMFDNNKLPLAQEAFKILQEQLTENDTVSIVTYAGSEEVVIEGVKGNDHDAIVEAIDSLEAWGSTNGEGGIIKAYDIAEKYFIEGGNNRVILATDGDLNVGVTSESGLIELIEEEKETGVFLSCLGFGSGNYQDDKMEALADHGNGNYSYIDCTREAEKVLKDELWSTIYTVAKDVKFQVEFNPALVKGYRLIGYENRSMSAEDFADDTKDGGELGTNQTVTVLYEVVTTDSDYKIPTVESKYDTTDDYDSTEFADELLTVNVRYKLPDSDESTLIEYPVAPAVQEMDNDTSWAAGVAQFAMLLRDSEYKGTSTYDDIYNRLSTDPDVMTDDFKAEFLYMITLAEDLGN